MAIRIVGLVILVAYAVIPVALANEEGDVLYAWKTQLDDPNNVLQSWDPTLVNPCTWFHVTCNSNNSVTRVDLGVAGLSGPLVPQLGLLSNLQYLEVYKNNLTGPIPKEIGNLKKLVSLDLYENRLSGQIPASLGKLTSLRFLRLNSNKLRGGIPRAVLDLVLIGNLQILNVSDNLLTGTVHSPNHRGFVVTTIIQDVKAPKL